MSHTQVLQAPLSILSSPRSPTAYELDQIELPEYPSSKPLGISTIKPLHDIEADSTPPSRRQNVTSIAPSFWFPAMNRWRVLAVCVAQVCNGMTDSAPGGLIPYLEKSYAIGYAVVSMIFITNAVGFVAAAFFVEPILARLGRGRALVLAEMCMLVGYVVIACAPPFALVTMAFLAMGFGNGLMLAYNNVFCANLANATVMLGAAHGSYGIGGTIGPTLVTLMVSSGIPWARFYTVLIGVRVFSMCLNGWSFWNYEKEQEQSEIVERIVNQNGQELEVPTKRQLLWRAVKTKVTILGALFVFAYQGAEVSESGWFITFLIEERAGDPYKVGFVTSGFWAGITIGRFTLTHLAHRTGEKVFVGIMGVAVIALQLMAWFIPDIVGPSVAVAILGLLLGPIYPCGQTVFSRLLPRSLQVTAIGFIGSAGSSGGALIPFLTGIISQAVNKTIVLHPICIAGFIMMLASWFALPRVEKRKE